MGRSTQITLYFAPNQWSDASVVQIDLLSGVVGQMEKGWREEVGLVTGSLRKKLVNFYGDAVDGYDDTTA